MPYPRGMYRKSGSHQDNHKKTLDVRPEEMDARYFEGRTDGLRMGRLARLMNAQIWRL
jgi:hypothetical protein